MKQRRGNYFDQIKVKLATGGEKESERERGREKEKTFFERKIYLVVKINNYYTKYEN